MPRLLTLCLLPLISSLFLVSPSASQIPIDGLVAYYPFNGNAHDESGNGNDGGVLGASLTFDRFGNPDHAYSFDGVDDLISIPNSSSLQSIDSEITLAAWVYVNGWYTNWAGLASKSNSIERAQYGVAFQPEGRIDVDLVGTKITLLTGFQFELSTWYFLAMRWDGEDVQVFVNESIVGASTYAPPPLANQMPFEIGRHTPVNTEYMNGLIDDIRLYDRALSDAEVQELYNGIPGSDPLAPYGVSYGSTGSPEPIYPGYLVTIDPLTGDATLVGPTGIVGNSGPSVPAIAIRSTGEIYAVSASTNAGLYTVNASTGAGTFVANTGISLPNAMAFDGYDQLYVTDGSSNLYTMDENTGSTTLIGPLGFNVRGIAFDPTDGTMYGSSGTDGIYSIDPTTALATFIGNTGLGGSTPDIHFDLDGNLYGTKIGGGTIYNYASISKQTGAGTVIGSTGFTAVIGLSARQVRSDVVPVTLEIEIDPEDQTVPPEGATFPYSMTFTNNTPRTQTVDYWTKLVRPIGNPFDPFDGPTGLILDPFETMLIDTNEVTVPPNAVPGDYLLIGYVGDYQADTLDSDTTGFTKLDDSIPCEEIAQFKARCRPGGLIQAKAIFTDFTHVGEIVEISVDQFPYEVTVGINGQATFSQTGFNPGVHTVELTDPAGCFPATQVTCGAGLAEEGGAQWEEDLEIPTVTALLGNYPNPFNPSTTFRYGLSEPGQVSLRVYNMLGQLVRTIVDEQQLEGYHEAVWNGRNEVGGTVASGIYIYRMTTGSIVETKRMLLVK